MKLENRQVVSQDDIEKIISLNESVKGTRDYAKFYMEISYKNKSWKYLGYGYPYRLNFNGNSGYMFTVRNGKVHIQSMTDEPKRYYVTERIMEEMGWWI